MDDFIFRAKATYFILTVTFCFMSLAMTQAGENSPHNTAWVLIVWLRNSLLSLGALGLTLLLMGAFIAARDEHSEAIVDLEEPRKIECTQFETPITSLDAATPLTPPTKSSDSIAEDRKRQSARAKEDQAKLEILRKEQRSTTEAAKEALDEFL